MLYLKLLSVALISLSVQADDVRWVDFRCDGDDCVIPYDKEGFKNGLEVCYTSADKKDKVKEVTWVKGKRQGPARCFRKAQVAKEATYQNDVINGLYIEHAYDARGARVQLVKNGIQDGYEFSVDKDGKVTDISWCFHRGKLDSAELAYCKLEDYGKYSAALKAYRAEQESISKEKAEKTAQRMNGPQKMMYGNGKVRSTYTNVDGRMTGLYTGYYENGKVREECEYKADKRHGNCTLYDDQGRIDAKEVYAEGELTAQDKFFDNGKMSESRKSNGKRSFCGTTFYDSGAKEAEFCEVWETHLYWRNYQGPYTSYSLEGKTYSRGQYDKGRHVGVWEYFNDDGSQSSVMTYSDKGLLEKSVVYYEFKIEKNQRVPYLHRIETEFFPDGSTKKETVLPGHSGGKPAVI